MTETPILCTGIPVVVWDVEKGDPVDSENILNNQFTWPGVDITFDIFDD